MIQTLGENMHIFKIELGGSRLRWRGEFATEREKIADCGVVVHLRRSFQLGGRVPEGFRQA